MSNAEYKEAEAKALEDAKRVGFYFKHGGVQIHYKYDECIERGWFLRFSSIYGRNDWFEGVKFEWCLNADDRMGLQYRLSRMLEEEEKRVLRARVEGML